MQVVTVAHFIRKYQDLDLPGVQVLLEELGYVLAQEELSTNIEAIADRGGTVFVAEDERVIVGCVCVVFDARLAEGVCAEIVSLIVGSHARAQGIGTSLVKTAEAWALPNVSKMRVRANTLRTSAHRFYTSRGYTEVKEQKVFVKTLSNSQSG